MSPASEVGPKGFPLSTYLKTMVEFLDIVDYDDNNYTMEDRKKALSYVYTKTAEHFAQPVQQNSLQVKPKKLQASIQTIVGMVVYSWARASHEVMADLSIHYTYTLLLDDSTDDPTFDMSSFFVDLVAGNTQKHPWWRMVNAHLPEVLKHYGSFCSLNLVRSTLDFFQGCWIEQSNFNGYPGSYDFPQFMRRLNGLGHCVGASLFPRVQINESEHFLEITTAISQMENWMVYVNDLMSFYKEFDAERDQTSLVNSYCEVEGITLDQALEKLTNDVIVDSRQLKAVFKDKSPVVRDILDSFMQGYITWHLCDARYRLVEICDKARDTSDAVKFRAYRKQASEVAIVPAESWARPLVCDIVERNLVNSNNKRKLISDDAPSELRPSNASESMLGPYDSPRAMDVLGLKHHTTWIK
ncbi:hypothetical protein D6D01_02198 [Aureobasidium pullulans]|uniref:Trichodiene synthase n=1 Tax=Aureobasidium pullulans TaxID=5580 RepID=A0A4S9LV56_AURPU|nr:hypothetical protein D6D01_02198 [Aureobasidium pullulans]